MNTTIDVGKGAEELSSVIKEAKNNPEVLNRIIENPMKELESRKIGIDDSLQDAVVENLENYAKIVQKKQAPVSIPQNLKVKKEDVAKEDPVKLTFWGIGFTLRLSHEACQEFMKGKDISHTLKKLLFNKVLKGLPEPGPIVIKAVFTACFLIVKGLVALADKGKGVNMSWNIPQLLAAFANGCNCLMAIPTVTPVR